MLKARTQQEDAQDWRELYCSPLVGVPFINRQVKLACLYWSQVRCRG